MDILKIATAGSVDDGKSTLIGRILYETKSLKDDQLEHIEAKSKAKGYDYLDFSLATDGQLSDDLLLPIHQVTKNIPVTWLQALQLHKRQLFC